jgi:hypothetical protein
MIISAKVWMIYQFLFTAASISLDYGIAEKSTRMPWYLPTLAGATWDHGTLCRNCIRWMMATTPLRDDIIILDSHNCVVRQTNKSLVLYGVVIFW